MASLESLQGSVYRILPSSLGCNTANGLPLKTIFRFDVACWGRGSGFGGGFCEERIPYPGGQIRSASTVSPRGSNRRFREFPLFGGDA